MKVWTLMTKLLTIVLTLALCSTGFASWTPDEAKTSLSIRSPYLEGVAFDYEVLIGAQDSVWSAECAFEREDGLLYTNIDLSLRSDQKRLIRVEIATKEKPAHSINQQSAMLGCKWIGYGAITERYIAEDVVDAWYFRIPLHGHNGNLTLTTDFDKLHIWTGFTEYTFETGSPFKPFVMAVIHIDKHSEFYQVKIGVKYVPSQN